MPNKLKIFFMCLHGDLALGRDNNKSVHPILTYCCPGRSPPVVSTTDTGHVWARSKDLGYFCCTEPHGCEILKSAHGFEQENV